MDETDVQTDKEGALFDMELRALKELEAKLRPPIPPSASQMRLMHRRLAMSR